MADARLEGKGTISHPMPCHADKSCDVIASVLRSEAEIWDGEGGKRAKTRGYPLSRKGDRESHDAVGRKKTHGV